MCWVRALWDRKEENVGNMQVKLSSGGFKVLIWCRPPKTRQVDNVDPRVDNVDPRVDDVDPRVDNVDLTMPLGSPHGEGAESMQESGIDPLCMQL